MNIRINQQLNGIEDITGTAVIIDVFRAFSVECHLLSNGAEKLLAVGGKQAAYDYRERHPGALLIGEREGAMLPGFNYGNSPSQVEGVDFTGKTVVHTTSAGTQGVSGAKNARLILGATLLNAAATAEYIKKIGEEDVTLVCMGLGAVEPTDEDTLCAEYIRAMLISDEAADEFRKTLPERIEGLKYTSGAKFFDPARQSVFPEKDFYLSTEIDRFDFAIKAGRADDGFFLMKKTI